MLELFFKKRRGLFLLAAAGVAAGIILVLQLPVKLYPNTLKPIIGVYISHPGYTASDFRDQYGTTLDEAFSGIRDAEEVEVEYDNGRSRARIEFTWDISYDEARNRSEAAMNAIKNNLPQDSRDYRVRSWTGENTGFMAVAAASSRMSPEALYALLESALKSELSAVEDAESVELVNVRRLITRVELDEDALLAGNLMIDDVVQAVRGGYKPEPVGSFGEDEQRYNVRLKKGIDSIFDIGDIRVARRGAGEILLRDVADVTVRYGLPESLFRMNGEQSIMIFATPKSGGNIKQMSTDIRSIIEDTQADLPGHVEFTYLIDPAEFVNQAIMNVLRAAALGALLAIGCVLLLLGEARNTLLIALSIPLSITLSFVLMYFFGLTINLISLSGLTLSIGMIIDSSIVAMENIHRHRFYRGGGEHRTPLRSLIVRAIGEVRGAVIASTLTSIMVFLPLSFTAPLTNAILGDLAKAVIFALACALAVALLVVPVLAYYLFRRPYSLGTDREGRMARFSERLMEGLRERYRQLLRGLLASRMRSAGLLLAAFTLLAGSLMVLMPRIEREIIAAPQSDKLMLYCRNADSDSREEMLEKIAPIEQELLDIYGGRMKSLFAQIYRDNAASFIISLTSSRHTEDVRRELEERYTSGSEWRYRVMPWDPAELPLPRSLDIYVRVTGPEKQQNLRYIEQAADLVRDADIYRNIWEDPSTGEAREIILSARPQTAGIYSTDRMMSVARTLLVGSSAIEMNHEGEAVEVRIEFPEGHIANISDFTGFLVPYRDGAIPLKHFFDTRIEYNVAEVVTLDGEEIFGFMGILPRDVPQEQRAEYEQQVRRTLAQEMNLDPGYSFVFENTQEELNDNVRSLLYALGVSLLLVYILLGLQFNSLRVPLVVMTAVPLGFIGVLASLYLFDSTISLNSMLGTILLGGITVNNSILMIDFYFKQLRGGEDRLEAIIRSAGLRLPPILITMLTTVLGMLPIAMALGDGTNIVQPLGIAVCGGLVISTLFTLFVVPVILHLFRIGSGKEEFDA